MPTLTPGKPFTVKDPHLLVENQLAAGRHRFQLVVIDDGGLESDPAELVVVVRQITRPRDPITRPDVVFRPDLIERVRVQPDLIRPIRPIRRPP